MNLKQSLILMRAGISSLLVATALVLPLNAQAEAERTNSEQLQALVQHTTDLELKLASLRQEIQELKLKLSAQNKHTVTPSHHAAKQVVASKNQAKRVGVATLGAATLKTPVQNTQLLPFDPYAPGQALVSTGPYVGVPIEYTGSHLVVNSPSVNTDVQLLGVRKRILQQLNKQGLSAEEDHSHLLLSGVVEAQAGYLRQGVDPSQTNIDVTSVSLDAFYIGPSEWTLAFLELSYNNSRPAGLPAGSNFYVNKAFITVGNLTRSPFYASLGQFYVPFGTYSSVLVTPTLSRQLARTKARALLIGVQEQDKNAFYASGYVFNGDTFTSAANKLDNGGVNFGYKFAQGRIGANFGAGLIANIADSEGMQGGTGFKNYETIQHRVPAYNLRGSVSIDERFNFIAEYVRATRRFNVADMSFNGRGARPATFDFQAAYSFYILDTRPSTLALAYGQSAEALAVGIPSSRYSLVLNTSLWRNTLQSLELRRDYNYSAGSTANGPTGAMLPCAASACVGSSPRYSNALTFQFDYYF